MSVKRGEQVIEKVRKTLAAPRPLVPWGKVASYGSLGRCVQLHPRAVGRACAALGNRYGPSEVPYHRIVHADGRLPKRFTGRGGVRGHRKLLRKEGHVIEKLKVRYRVEDFEDCLVASPRRPARRHKK